MGENKSINKQGDTTKKTTMLKHQVAGKVTMEGVVKIGEELKVPDAWYRIVKIHDKQWVEFEQDKMQPRDSIMNTFYRKFCKQTPWGDEELLYMLNEGKLGKAVEAALLKWDLDGTNFYLQLEGKLRLHKDSHISRELKRTYQSAVEGKSMITDETEISTVTTDTLHENEKLKDMLAKHQDTIPKEVLDFLMKTGTPPQDERGVK